jgi:hypothetical protein
MDSCAAVSEIEPGSACGHTNRSAAHRLSRFLGRLIRKSNRR